MGRRYTSEEYAAKLAAISPDIEIVGTYTGAVNRIKVRCRVCGKTWEPKAYNLLQGKGCPHCSAVRGSKANSGITGLKTLEQFAHEMEAVNPSVELLGDYVNSKTKTLVRCRICGHEWRAQPNALLGGHGCPRCAKSGTSFMEQFILLSFRKVLGEKAVLSRDKTSIGMELDVVVPSKHFAVEPGSWSLHKRNLKRDLGKRNRCRAKGIRLITVYDQFPQNRRPPFDRDCLVFTRDLNSGDHSELKGLVSSLLAMMDEDFRFSRSDWSDIEARAGEQSRAMTHEDFVVRLREVNPNIEVLGRYVNANSRLPVRCRKCGHEWNAVPANMLAGDGCRVCGSIAAHDKFRKSQEEFERQVHEANPDIEIVGRYSSRHSRVHAKCRICGYEWDPVASSLLRGSNHKGWKGMHKLIEG